MAARPMVWGKVWTLVAWCELRDDFRMFRIDRIAEMVPQGEPYPIDPARSLRQFYRQMEEECRGAQANDR